jgi:hypothetical protein
MRRCAAVALTGGRTRSLTISRLGSCANRLSRAPRPANNHHKYHEVVDVLLLSSASLPNPSLTSSTSDRKGSRKPKKSRVCTGWLLIMRPHSSLGQLTAADSTRRSIFFDRMSLTAIG